MRRCLVVLVSPLVLGCETELELPPVIEASEHLILRGEDDVCAGTFVELEDRVLAVQEAFGAPAVAVEYNWMLDRFPEAGCVDGAAACTRRHEVFAKGLALEHELIHAARADLLPAPLEEGLATFLGGDRMSYEGTREDLRAAIEADDAFSYQRASEFVQFLVQVGGFEKLRELDAQAGYLASFSDWHHVVEDVYGQTWDEIWTGYLATPECDPETMTDDVLLCYASNTGPVNLTPGVMTPRGYMHDMSCDSVDVVGPVFGDEVRHEVLIEFDEPMYSGVWVSLEGDVEPGTGAFLSRCGPCAGEPAAALTYEHDLDLMIVEPGLYVLELRRQIYAPGPLGVQVSF
jgi:hypothetical protein